MKAPSSIPTFAVMAGALVMLFLGWAMGGKEPVASGSAAPVLSNARLSDREARPYGKYRTPAHAVNRVGAIRALPSRAEQMRATIALVNSLTLEELAEWIEGRWFDHGGDYNLTLFNKIAEKRWQAEDPDGYLAYQIRQGGSGVYQTMERLARDEPERLFAYFREHPNAQMEFNFLQRVAETHPAMALKRARELIESGAGLDEAVRGQLGYALRKIASGDPALVEGLLDTLPSYFAREVEKGIVSKSLTDSFSETLRDLGNRPDGWSLFAEAEFEGKGEKLLAEIHNLPAAWKSMIAQNPYSIIRRENAAQWLDLDFKAAGFTDEQAKTLVSRSLYYVMEDDPQRVLLQMDRWGIEKDDRMNLIHNLFSRVPTEEASAMLAQLQSDEERARASEILESRTGSATDREIALPKTPGEWIDTVSGLEDGSLYPFVSQLRTWEPEKVAEITTSFHDLPAGTKDKLAASLLDHGTSSPPALRAEAVRHQLTSAEQESGNTTNDPFARRSPEAAASSLAVEWMQSDPGAASQWVNSLPTGDAKLWAQKNLARNWALYDPDAAKMWVNSLPGEAKTEVKQYLEGKN